MKDQFVPYKLAVKLKEKGFNEKCFATYEYDSTADEVNPYYTLTHHKNSDNHVSGFSAPLWQQAIEWLREEKGIDLIFKRATSKDKFFPLWKFKDQEEYWGDYIYHDSYYSAFQSGIEKALELI